MAGKSITVHYLHPRLSYHACGMGNPANIKMSCNLSEVTCKRCLGTTVGGKNSNRQIGDKPKVSKTIRLNADLAKRLKERSQVSGKTEIDLIEAALAQYLKVN